MAQIGFVVYNSNLNVRHKITIVDIGIPPQHEGTPTQTELGGTYPLAGSLFNAVGDYLEFGNGSRLTVTKIVEDSGTTAGSVKLLPSEPGGATGANSLCLNRDYVEFNFGSGEAAYYNYNRYYNQAGWGYNGLTSYSDFLNSLNDVATGVRVLTQAECRQFFAEWCSYTYKRGETYTEKTNTASSCPLIRWNYQVIDATFWYKFFTGETPVINGFPGDISDVDGGDGDFDETSDEIDFPTLTPFGASDTGFINIYNPTIAEIYRFSGYLWGIDFDLDNFKKLYNSPEECIVGCMLNYATPTVFETPSQVKLGNVLLTGQTMHALSRQFATVDCGSLSVTEYWGNALDYEPFTELSIYLPFVGIVPLKNNEIMNGTISVKYYVDFLSGACVAMVKTVRGNLSAIIGIYNGKCGIEIPWTSSNKAQYAVSLASTASTLATGLMTGGGNIASSIGTGLATANDLASTQMHVQRGGAIQADFGAMSIKKPYLIITRPTQSLADKYNNYNGYPSNITAKLSDLTGYTRVQSIQLTGVSANDTELQEIDELLKSGVII